MTDDYKKYLKYKRKYLEKKRVGQEGGSFWPFNRQTTTKPVRQVAPLELNCSSWDRDLQLYKNKLESNDLTTSSINSMIEKDDPNNLGDIIKRLNSLEEEKKSYIDKAVAIDGKIKEVKAIIEFKKTQIQDITRENDQIKKRIGDIESIKNKQGCANDSI